MKKGVFCVFVLSMVIFASTSYATLLNPGFEDPGFFGWTHSGIVSQVSGGTVSFDGYTYDIAPTEGNSMALLSAPGLSGGGSYGSNSISQTITDFAGGNISFDYNMFSVDWRGHDRFTVDIDAADDMYDYHWEIDELSGTPSAIEPFEFYYSGWFSHDIGNYAGDLTITLSCGNGVDDNWNTWTYVDNFSVAIPDASTLLLFATAFWLIVIVGFRQKYRVITD